MFTRRPKAPTKGQTGIRLTRDARDRIKAAADMMGISQEEGVVAGFELLIAARMTTGQQTTLEQFLSSQKELRAARRPSLPRRRTP